MAPLRSSVSSQKWGTQFLFVQAYQDSLRRLGGKSPALETLRSLSMSLLCIYPKALHMLLRILLLLRRNLAVHILGQKGCLYIYIDADVAKLTRCSVAVPIRRLGSTWSAQPCHLHTWTYKNILPIHCCVNCVESVTKDP